MIDPRIVFREALASSDAEPVDAFADPAAERQALAQGAALFLRSRRRVWRVTGEDAVDYLHRMLTQDIKGIPVPGGRRACLLNRQGRVLGDFFAWRFEDDLCVLDGEPEAQIHALPVLEKFVIADDVTFEDVTHERVRIVLSGPGAAEVLKACDIEVPDVGACTSLGDEGSYCQVLGAPHGDGVRFELLAERGGVAPYVDALFEQQVVPVGQAAFEHERIRVCEPRQPQELDESILFNESQLEAAVSWNKGCYPGQEPVIMARHRGRPPNVLVGLSGRGAGPTAGDVLRSGDREVGRITSVTAEAEGWIGLGYVRTAVAEQQGSLSCGDDETCEIRG